jgi:hypothetical protein
MLISRRAFAKTVSTAGLGGTALLETMLVEAQEKGSLSQESVKAFLELTDQTLDEAQIEKVKNSLERSLRSIRRIRNHEVPQSLEPATMFRVRR